MKHLIIILFFILGIAKNTFAQLPSIDVKLTNGKVTVFWVSQYNGIASITVQRSTNPSQGYISIGSLEKQNRGPQKFIDEQPIAGTSYYRLQILFESEIEWYSDVKELIADASSLAVTNSNTDNNITTETEPIITKPSFYFEPSTKVFTDPITGHINIILLDAVSKRYSLEFFDGNNNEILKLDRISKGNIILDKHNLNRKGYIAFKLYESGKMIEKGYVNIF